MDHKSNYYALYSGVALMTEVTKKRCATAAEKENHKGTFMEYISVYRVYTPAPP